MTTRQRRPLPQLCRKNRPTSLDVMIAQFDIFKTDESLLRADKPQALTEALASVVLLCGWLGRD
jgi:hypothetical protein